MELESLAQIIPVAAGSNYIGTPVADFIAGNWLVDGPRPITIRSSAHPDTEPPPSFSDKGGGPLFQKRANTFLIVAAVVDHAAQRLDALKHDRRQIVCVRE